MDHTKWFWWPYSVKGLERWSQSVAVTISGLRVAFRYPSMMAAFPFLQRCEDSPLEHEVIHLKFQPNATPVAWRTNNANRPVRRAQHALCVECQRGTLFSAKFLKR